MTDHSHDLASLMQAFFQERLANQRRAAANTVKSYRDAWKQFLQFLRRTTGKRPDHLSLDDLTAETVLAFLDDVETTRRCCTRTRNQRLAALRAFFHYVSFARPERLDQCRRVLQISSRRCERPVFGFLAREEMDAMLSATDRRSALGRRHAALILFLYNTGARVEEAASLTAGRIRFEKPPHVRLMGKGSKERLVPLWEETAQTLSKQIAEQGAAGQQEAHVFVNRRGRRLTRGGVAYILEKARKKAAKSCPALARKHVTPHTLRHTTAMHLLQAGVDLNLIRCWLGHVSFETTHQYVEADLEMKRAALTQGKISVLPGGPKHWKPTEDILAFLESL